MVSAHLFNAKKLLTLKIGRKVFFNPKQRLTLIR